MFPWLFVPFWHILINSDQGVDPKSINQFAYVNGMPFMAKVPGGMMTCLIFRYDVSYDGGNTTKGNIPAVELIADPTYYEFFCFGDSEPNGGGGGFEPGGGYAGDGSGDGKKDTKQESKTDCELYADALVQSASDYREKYSITGVNRFGADLYKRARTNKSLSSFDLAPNYSGFRDELVNGGQKSDVYRHVSASIGISLAFSPTPFGLMLSLAQTLIIDLPQHILGNPEAKAEMKGNLAGMQLSLTFGQFFYGNQQAEQLRSEIRKILCGK